MLQAWGGFSPYPDVMCVVSGGGRAVPGGGGLGVPLGPQRQQRPLQPGVCPLGPTEGLEPLELPLAVQWRDVRSHGVRRHLQGLSMSTFTLRSHRRAQSAPGTDGILCFHLVLILLRSALTEIWPKRIFGMLICRSDLKRPFMNGYIIMKPSAFSLVRYHVTIFFTVTWRRGMLTGVFCFRLDNWIKSRFVLCFCYLWLWNDQKRSKITLGIAIEERFVY